MSFVYHMSFQGVNYRKLYKKYKDKYRRIIRQKICKREDGPEYGYIGEIYAGGMFYVYNVCDEYGCATPRPMLAKIYLLEKDKSKVEVEREAEYMRRAFILGVTPACIDLLECEYDSERYAIILMEKYGDGTLTELLDGTSTDLSALNLYETFKGEIHTQLKTILDTLYTNDISHNDLHSDNFLFKLQRDESGNKLVLPPEIKIIDFDYATPNNGKAPVYKIEDRNINKLLPSIKEMEDRIKLMKESRIDLEKPI